MSALLRKETRLILPSWIGALLAAAMPLLAWQDDFPALFAFCGGIVALALTSFGQEVSCGTFGLMLVQPVERRRFWNAKVGLLALALASVWGLHVLCLYLTHLTHWNLHADDNVQLSALLVILAFSGGLWSTLLLRDNIAAFVCTCAAPPAICALLAAMMSYWFDPEKFNYVPIFYYVSIVYSVAGFFWARRLFLDAQDLAWTGGQVSPKFGWSAPLRRLAFEFKGGESRWVALVKKEVRLQEMTLFLLPLLILLHLAGLAAYHFVPHWAAAKDVLLGTIPMIWLAVIPLLIGSAAVAEERRLNTMDGLLCLPVSKRASFAVKFAVTLFMGVVVGGIVPWLLLRMSEGTIRGFDLTKAVTVVAVITGVAFYASTMSRSILQAVPIAFAVPMVTGAIVFAFVRFTLYKFYTFSYVQSGFFFPLLWPAIILTLIWLAFNNYKRLQLGWRVWCGDLAKTAVVLGCVNMAALMIFDRDWELFQRLEPPHGPARISGTGQARLKRDAQNIGVLLPDGRLWAGEIPAVKFPKRENISGGFVDGSNWVTIAANNAGILALRSDGSLWTVTNKSGIHQIGLDHDWKKIASGGLVSMAVKQNGTLWGWGKDDFLLLNENEDPSHYRQPHVKTPSNQRATFLVKNPIRLRDDADWDNIFIVDGGATQAIGIKSDGSVWSWGEVWGKPVSLRHMERSKIDGTNWISVSGSYDCVLGLRADGTLWTCGCDWEVFGQDIPRSPNQRPVQVGTKSDWISAHGGWPIVALDSKGRFWVSVYGKEKKPSKYADWLAATSWRGETYALAKDGTLTCWDDRIYIPNDPTFREKFFLGSSRRPVFTTNILDSGK